MRGPGEQRDLAWTLVDAGVLSVRGVVVTSGSGRILASGSTLAGMTGATQDWVLGGQCVIGCDAGTLVAWSPTFMEPTDGGASSNDAGMMMDGG